LTGQEAPPAAASAVGSSASSAHVLHQYPRAYFIPGEKLRKSIYVAYAHQVRPEDALQVMRDANAFRMEADLGDPEVTYIETTVIPPPLHNDQQDVWSTAFQEARKSGPRMLAGLLLTVNPSQFDEQAKKDRQALLDYLRSLPQ
jgi:hypothetical protein